MYTYLQALRKINELEEAGKVLACTNDCIFKSCFQDKKLKGILAYLISEITNMDFKFVKENLIYLNTEYPKSKFIERKKISDIVVEVKGHSLILEMNNKYNEASRLKGNLYHHKLASEKYLISEPLEESKVILINFNNEKENEEIETYQMLNIKTKKPLDNTFLTYNVNLQNAKEKWYNEEELTRFEKILVIMQLEEKEKLEKLSKGDEELMGLVEKLKRMSKDENTITLYNQDDMYEMALNASRMEGKKDGVAAGIAEGETNKSLEIAKNMLQDGAAISLITKYTGLTKKEIEDLK